MAKTAFYSTDEMTTGRYVILNDIKQDVPKGPLRVTDRAMRKTADGREYPVIMADDEHGNGFIISAWPRDVRGCIEQWGGEPKDWGQIRIELARGGMRYCVVPAGEKPPKESRV
jgi:hypothetical protein